jgi:hypothetical protein
MFASRFLHARNGESECVAMWGALIEKPHNLVPIVQFLIREGNARGGQFVRLSEAVCAHYATTQLEATIHAVGAEIRQILLLPSAPASESQSPVQLRLAPTCTDPTAQGHFSPDVNAVVPFESITGRDSDVSSALQIMGELAARCQHTWGDELIIVIHYCCLCFENTSRVVLDMCRRVLLNLVLNVSTGSIKQFPNARQEVGSKLPCLLANYSGVWLNLYTGFPGRLLDGGSRPTFGYRAADASREP